MCFLNLTNCPQHHDKILFFVFTNLHASSATKHAEDICLHSIFKARKCEHGGRLNAPHICMATCMVQKPQVIH